MPPASWRVACSAHEAKATSPQPCNGQQVETVPYDTLFEVCDWVDTIPLSRVRKHLGKDFSDGVSCFRPQRIFFFFDRYI